jgi:peroxiredoxin
MAALLCLLASTTPGINAASFHPLDLPKPLSASTNANLKGLPSGAITVEAVPFRIHPPLRLTGMERARDGQLDPVEITGIKVGYKAGVIHLLLGVDGMEKDGVPLASVVLHYSGGRQATTRLAYGLHTRSLLPVRYERPIVYDPNSGIAWQTNRLQGRQSSTLRLYRTAIPNPNPSEKIESVDLVSLFSRATPFIVAMTVEEHPSATRIIEPRPNRVSRAAQEFEDFVYHDKIAIRAQSPDGKPDPTAEASLLITDMEGSYYFGRNRADASGRIQFSIPPQHAASLTVVVRARNRIPFIYVTPKFAPRSERQEIVATLQAGLEAGGIVRNAAGEPVSNANVTIYRLTQKSPREYERMDYDSIHTDVDGKWRSTAMPKSLEGFQFAISHADYRPRLYTMESSPRTPRTFSLRPDELQSGQAAAVLDPALLLTGRIENSARRPVADAEIRLGSSRSDPTSSSSSSGFVSEEIIGRSDATGRYKLAVVKPGTYSVIVLADGCSPQLSSVTLRDGPPQVLNFELPTGRSFTGTVIDQNQQPVIGAKVRLESWNDNRLLKFETETDDAGKFVWTNAPDGQLRFYLSATNYSSTTYSISGSFQHRFTLRRFSSVRGTVVDAETKKPINDFSVFRGRAYNPEEPIRWERYNTFRGRNGEYNVRLVEYSSRGKTAVLIEAPGYVPAASETFTKAGNYTNNFELKKGRGVSGQVVAADGTPVMGANLVLLEPAEYAYLRINGDLQRSSDSGVPARSDRAGQFEFSPRLAPHTIIATHDKGFAEVRITNALAPVLVTLQPWAHVSGVVKLPLVNGRPHAVRLHNTFYRYADESRESQPLSLFLSADAGPDGSFAFNRVPPGERRVSLYHSIRINDSTRSMNSHSVSLTLEPGQSTNIVIGGSGRTVTGRMTVVGADPQDVDWLRDFHQLTPVRPLNMNIPRLEMSGNLTQEQQEAIWAQQRRTENAFWRTPAGRAYEREQKSYLVQFATNGTFRVDGIPPGEYNLNISLTDPTREDYSYENIGTFGVAFTLPELKPGQPDEPFDLGPHEIAVRGILRIGRKAPRFTVRLMDNTEVKLEDFRNKFVLIDFWATWAGTRSYDLQSLKTIYERYAKDDRLVMVGISLDNMRQAAEEELKKNPLPWRQAYGGTWSESTFRITYALRSVPECVLIDPDGKLAGINLRGPNIARTVERLLGEPKP